LKKGKVYVPKKEELRAEVIQLHYDVPAAVVVTTRHNVQ